MSVDYNSCEFCGEAIYEEYCPCRPIDEEYLYICDDCLEEEIENGNIIQIDEDSEITESEMTKLEIENINNYEYIYRRTKSGKIKRIKEIEVEIETLEYEKKELLKTI